jgi:hypothetical protein
VIVTHRHLRELGYCNRGSRAFFERHGLNWSEFLENGIDSSTLLAIDDAQAHRVVEHASKG